MIRDTESEIHFLEYWRVLQKRGGVGYTTLAVVVTTVALGSLLMEPVYTASTRLLIEHNAPNVLPFQAVTVREHDYVLDYHATRHGLIRSKTVARDVIAALDLADHPDYEVNLPKRVADFVAHINQLTGLSYDRPIVVPASERARGGRRTTADGRFRLVH